MSDIIIIKIGCIIFSAVWLFLGYLIFYKKKYRILVGYQLGHFNEQVSKYIGLAIFIIGCKLLVISIVLIIFL